MAWTDDAVSVYCVLGLGSFMGATTKGITGFGSAILHLCVWVACKSAGIQSGTLQQAVLIESLCSTALAAPLIYVTRAWQTADLKLLVCISIFVTLGSPIGAKMLSSMDVRNVELVISGLLAIMLLLSTRLPSLVVRCICQSCCGGCGKRQKIGAGAADTIKDVDTIEGSAAGGDMIVVEVLQSDEDSQVLQQQQPSEQQSESHPQLPGQLPQHFQHANQQEYAASVDAASSDDLSDVTQPLLDSRSSSRHSSSSSGSSSKNEADGLLPASLPSEQHVAPQPGSRREMWAWLRVFGLASVAGTVSGIMEGLTGMNGPPIILLYQFMGTTKSCVRGTNAFLNLLQFRIIAYFYVGMFSWHDAELYAVCITAGLAGVLFGNGLAALMPQELFQRVMKGLMVLCAVLMLASGMGLVQ